MNLQRVRRARLVQGLARGVRAADEMRLWKPDHLRFAAGNALHIERNTHAGLTDGDHLREAVGWLQRAQDVTADGGVSGRYSLRSGWTSSYPETTGYIIPTFLKLAQTTRDEEFVERAQRCVRFLLSTQLSTGAFPGGEIAENRTQPSPFNTAQILHGLFAWYCHSKEQRVLDAAIRAADWLVSVQDPDGAFRQYFYEGAPATYSSHASCWLAEFGAHIDKRQYLNAAERHLDWVLQHFDREAAWFDLCGFDRKQHEARVAVTHTIAYTIFGVLHMSQALQREDGVEAARLAALGALRRTELRSGVPGLMSVGWRAAADFVCLTGNAQLALIWFRLFDIDGDLRYVNAALKALDQVKRAQPVHVEHPGLRGGIPGSAPVWGDCISYAVPNWAAKFFIDALLTKDEVMRKVATSRMNSRAPVPDRTVTADGGAAFAEREIKIIGFTQSGAEKPAKLLAETARWGFSPEAMIIETGKPAPLAARIRDRARRDGIAAIVSAVRKRLTAAPVNGASAGSEGAGADMDPEELCHQRGIPVYTVESVNTPEALQLIARLEPDIAVLLGAGILKKSVLAIPNMATLNAHMGLLPFYRGMNVTEWAALNGDPVGCTVHQVDSGIDTGPILATRTVSHDGAGSIAELRDRVDREQIRLLAEVLEFIVTRRAMPAAKVQAREDGLQFYRMHDELKRVLEHDLQAAAVSRGARPAG